MSAPLIIASQMTDAFNERLRARVDAKIFSAPASRPWSVAGDADILIVRPGPAWRADPPVARPADWPGRLKWVASATTGVDFYPRWLLDAPIVTCGRGAASEEIADYVMAAIYLRTKDIAAVRTHAPAEWQTRPLGRIADCTVGIVGFGTIGRAVARRALAAGALVKAARRRPLASEIDGVELVDTIQHVVATANHLVLALPGTDATRHVVDVAMLGHAPRGAHLINVGRGSVLDHGALTAALDAGRLSFATLDVTDPEPLPEGHPLWTHPQVLLTPHVSANHHAAHDTYMAKVAADIERFARGKMPTDIVNPAEGY